MALLGSPSANFRQIIIARHSFRETNLAINRTKSRIANQPHLVKRGNCRSCRYANIVWQSWRGSDRAMLVVALVAIAETVSDEASTTQVEPAGASASTVAHMECVIRIVRP